MIAIHLKPGQLLVNRNQRDHMKNTTPTDEKRVISPKPGDMFKCTIKEDMVLWPSQLHDNASSFYLAGRYIETREIITVIGSEYLSLFVMSSAGDVGYIDHMRLSMVKITP